MTSSERVVFPFVATRKTNHRKAHRRACSPFPPYANQACNTYRDCTSACMRRENESGERARACYRRERAPSASRQRSALSAHRRRDVYTSSSSSSRSLSVRGSLSVTVERFAYISTSRATLSATHNRASTHTHTHNPVAYGPPHVVVTLTPTHRHCAPRIFCVFPPCNRTGQ